MEVVHMSDPKFSKRVEATQKASLANPDKNVTLYIRSPGSSDREKFGRLIGRRLFIPDDSNCAGYLFTHEEWMNAVKIGKHYHLRIEQHDFHNVITQISQSLNKTRRVTRRFSQFIRDGFKITSKKTKEQKRIQELERQILAEKKENNNLKRKIAAYKGTVADISTVGYSGGVLPPTDLYAISFLRKLFDSVAVYTKVNEKGETYLMIDLLEGNFSSQGRPASWTESQIEAKKAMEWGQVRVRLLSMHDDDFDSLSPHYRQNWEILFDLEFD
ncbi:MAG: hypothetical protein CXT68_08980 [Methanobacteriota archaeon]|nr:MAG: hypothetical protein CXT68_08980 [Euryarchaeota archaeon]